MALELKLMMGLLCCETMFFTLKALSLAKIVLTNHQKVDTIVLTITRKEMKDDIIDALVAVTFTVVAVMVLHYCIN